MFNAQCKTSFSYFDIIFQGLIKNVVFKVTKIYWLKVKKSIVSKMRVLGYRDLLRSAPFDTNNLTFKPIYLGFGRKCSSLF